MPPSKVYVGSSVKTLYFRFHDHKGVSSRTGRPLQSPLYSAIRDHCHEVCKIGVYIEDFKVIFKGNSENQIRLAESMYIRNLKPELNLDSSSFPLKF